MDIIEIPVMTNNIETKTVTTQEGFPEQVHFHYIKSSLYRTIHVDGVSGGPTPQGLIQVAIFSERFPIPKETVQKLLKHGELGEEILEQRITRSGIIREVEANIVMKLDVARNFANWLLSRVDEIEQRHSEKTSREKK